MIGIIKKLLLAGDEDGIEKILREMEQEAFMAGYSYAIAVLKQNIVKKEAPSS